MERILNEYLLIGNQGRTAECGLIAGVLIKTLRLSIRCFDLQANRVKTPLYRAFLDMAQQVSPYSHVSL